jgi:WD40 repeat protein
MQILAALTDDSVRVWDAWSGQLLQRLEGHAGRAHVLECHPLDHRLAMSAGYDGLTIIWDIIAGRALTRLASHTLFEAFGKSAASRSW